MHGKDGDFEEKIRASQMAVKLRQSFLQEYDTVICGGIHKNLFGRNYDMWNDVDLDQFNEDGAHTEKCTKVVAKASAATVKVILETAEELGMSLEDIRISALA